MRELPLVVTVLDSHRQAHAGGPSAQQRRDEDRAAMEILGAEVRFLGASDASPDWAEVEMRLRRFEEPEMVYAPAPEEGGNVDHNIIGDLASRIFQNVTYYMTYTNRGKSEGQRVDFGPEWPAKKLRALACYESQIRQKNQVEHFLREQHEYYQA